jgi:hypothetical protein
MANSRLQNLPMSKAAKLADEMGFVVERRVIKRYPTDKAGNPLTDEALSVIVLATIKNDEGRIEKEEDIEESWPSEEEFHELADAHSHTNQNKIDRYTARKTWVDAMKVNVEKAVVEEFKPKRKDR